MLKIIMVRKALGAVISFPKEIKSKNVNETIIGGHNQYTNIVPT